MSFMGTSHIINPLDPDSDPTGTTISVLDEHDETPAGVPRHRQDAIEDRADLTAVVEAGGGATVATLHDGTAIQALW